MLRVDSWETTEGQEKPEHRKRLVRSSQEVEGKPTESGFHRCQRILIGKGFVTFNKYSIIAFVLWVENSA